MNQPPSPDSRQFETLVQQIFDSHWWTNFGAIHQQFESALRDFLGCPYVLPVTNATFGLFTILKALDIRGEVITTPLTFPATPHVLFNTPEIQPVFVDVCPEDFCLSPESVRAAITPRTSAILAVHAYGFPCRAGELETIAAENGLKLIFDAAPAFGVRHEGRSVAEFGDASVFSFHATKAFSTGEGGAIVCRDRKVEQWCRRFINFGITGEDSIELPGLNGKMDEFRAALGLVSLSGFPAVVERRRRVVEFYLRNLERGPIKGLTVPSDVFRDRRNDLNYTYFPVVIQNTGVRTRDRVHESLQEEGIVARKYYFPTVLDLPIYEAFEKRIEAVPIARRLSQDVLCLPVNPLFEEDDCAHVINTFRRTVQDLENRYDLEKKLRSSGPPSENRLRQVHD